jgi:hypothetical protein
MKILFVIILSLIGFGSVTNAKIITFEKCTSFSDGRFDKDTYEKDNLVIDTEKKTITEVAIHTDKSVQNLKELVYKNHSNSNLSHLYDKVQIKEYNLVFIDEDYAKGFSRIIESNGYVSGENKIQISLRKKSYEHSIELTGVNQKPISITRYCK